MKFVLAGSRKIDPELLRQRIDALLAGAEEPVEIHLRKGLWTPPNPFERMVADIVEAKRQVGRLIWVVYHTPDPDEHHPGRASVYLRDIEMIEGSDLVLLFFDEYEAVHGYSGTAHLLDKALEAGVRVEAMTVDKEGRTHWLGGYDPRHA